jgi:pilus assembly protein Flp/PilA
MRKLSTQAGVTMIEYALIAALVGVAAIVALTTLGTDIKAKFTSIGTAVSSAGT